MTNRKKVAALLPAYQASGFIGKTLDSLASQTFRDFELIISVDLCEDDTYNICRNYCTAHDNFRVIKQDYRLGWVGNCNFLLDQANSELALFVPNDDILAPDCLEKLFHVLNERPKAVISYSDIQLSWAEGKKERWQYPELHNIRDRLLRARTILSRTGSWWVPYHGMFRLDQARKVKGFKHHGAGDFSAEWPWLFHLSLLGEFIRVPEPLCYKFYRHQSLSRSWLYTPDQWGEVSQACMAELWSSDLPLEEKLLLTGQFDVGYRLTSKLALKSDLP